MKPDLNPFRKPLTFFLLSLYICSQFPCLAQEKLLVAVQPLGKIKPELLEKVKAQIKQSYDVKVVIKPELPLPKEAYYPAGGRYRAEKILAYLRKIDTSSTRIMGVTDKDISTTKGKYPDWGIIGLGDIGGRACVVSTFRMRGTKTKCSQKVFEERCSKVIAHELGHTFGLKHCPAAGCLMQDYKGTVHTITTLSDFCMSCKEKLAQSVVLSKK